MSTKPPYGKLEEKITALVQENSELKHREDLYRIIFENAPLGILHFDNKGVITACNDNFAHIIGSSQEMLIGLNMLKLPDTRIVHALEKTLNGQISFFEGKYSSVTANKTTPVRLIFNPVFSSEEIVDGGIGIIEDVSERKQAEKELKESERRFRELAEMLPETIFEIDLHGKLTFVNQKAFDLFGYTKKDFEKGINVLDLIQAKDKEIAIANIGKILHGEQVGITEYEVLRKDGTFFPGLFHSSVITDNNIPVGLRGFLIDITEKKRTQEIIVQSEKMMSVGGLAAGMAHEINNPLAGMIQNAQVVINRLSKELPANEKAAKESGTSIQAIKTYMGKREIFQLLGYINTSGRQAAKIVQNMLSFAKKQAPLKAAHDIQELVEKTLNLIENDYDFKREYDFKKIKIIRDFDPDLPKVICEKSKIQQVLINIIKNSVDAVIEIQKTTKDLALQIRLKKENKMIRMEIEDNGPGIDYQTRKRIFEPFFTTKNVDKGTGLGLSISYFIIVDNHKGEMEVKSSPGKGTKFIIKLPI